MEVYGGAIILEAVADDWYELVCWNDVETNETIIFGIDAKTVNYYDENRAYKLTALFRKLDYFDD